MKCILTFVSFAFAVVYYKSRRKVKSRIFKFLVTWLGRSKIIARKIQTSFKIVANFGRLFPDCMGGMETGRPADHRPAGIFSVKFWFYSRFFLESHDIHVGSNSGRAHEWLICPFASYLTFNHSVAWVFILPSLYELDTFAAVVKITSIALCIMVIAKKALIIYRNFVMTTCHDKCLK